MLPGCGSMAAALQRCDSTFSPVAIKIYCSLSVVRDLRIRRITQPEYSWAAPMDDRVLVQMDRQCPARSPLVFWSS